MLDNDDIRYTAAEERPPWELSPGGQIREWFSCRKVDDTTAGYCHEVEEQKKARTRAQTHRSASHARLQRQREEAQNRLLLEQQQAKQRMAEARERVQANPEAVDSATPPSKDPRAARYTYSESAKKPPVNRVNRRRQKKGNKAGIIIGVVIMVVSFAAGFISDMLEEEPDIQSIFEEDTPSVTEEAPDDDFAKRFGQEDIPWDQLIPGMNQEDEEESETTALPRTETGAELSLDIHSAEGMTALTYQQLYERCLPSVVSIRVYDEGGGGTGTGIVMSEDGYILTCNHVVAGGERCEITTYDDQTFEALLVGGDVQTDLAVLKVDAEGLTPAQFGDSDELTVGDQVLAIGDPLGTQLRGTLTNGIVSAINRNVTVKSYPMTLIQTTAALNSGNSGGPLINIYGQVVGVTNMKMISGIVTVEGLGFAVPTSVVRDIVPVLGADGKVSRPVLGITCYGVDEDMAEEMDLPTTGLRVATINSASNANEAGLEVGDYIIAVNGEHMVSVEQVKPVLSEVGIGGEVTLTVRRYADEDATEWEDMEIVVTIMDQADLR